MKEAIKDRKADVEARHAAGTMDKEQRDIFIAVIDKYLSVLSESSEPDGTPIPSGRAMKFAKEVRKGAAGEDTKKHADPPDHYPSPYKKGKWDDIPKEEDK